LRIAVGGFEGQKDGWPCDVPREPVPFSYSSTREEDERRVGAEKDENYRYDEMIGIGERTKMRY